MNSKKSFTLVLQTEEGVNYEILFSDDFSRTFELMQSIEGDGTELNIPIKGADEGNGFYSLPKISARGLRQRERNATSRAIWFSHGPKVDSGDAFSSKVLSHEFNS